MGVGRMMMMMLAVVVVIGGVRSVVVVRGGAHIQCHVIVVIVVSYQVALAMERVGFTTVRISRRGTGTGIVHDGERQNGWMLLWGSLVSLLLLLLFRRIIGMRTVVLHQQSTECDRLDVIIIRTVRGGRGGRGDGRIVRVTAAALGEMVLGGGRFRSADYCSRCLMSSSGSGRS